MITHKGKFYKVLDKFTDGCLVISKDGKTITNLHGVLGRENWTPIEPLMLTNEQIADNLLSDIESYKENIREIIIGRLMDSSCQRTYWDAWFRGATGKDLENADKGIIYKK